MQNVNIVHPWILYERWEGEGEERRKKELITWNESVDISLCVYIVDEIKFHFDSLEKKVYVYYLIKFKRKGDSILDEHVIN